MAATTSERVELEWLYSPATFFEQDFSFVHEGCTFSVTPGRVAATFAAAPYDAKPAFRLQLTEQLEMRFLAEQLVVRQPYDLKAPSERRIATDGTVHALLFAESAAVAVVTGVLDTVSTDKEGNVISDTKASRLANRKGFGELIVEHSDDPVLRAMLSSWRRSLTDAKDELVHLYEIRDALAKHFKGETEARNALGFDKKLWSDFGRTCNAEPVEQGRHRGAHAGQLRPATSEELGQARLFGEKMIRAYAATIK